MLEARDAPLLERAARRSASTEPRRPRRTPRTPSSPPALPPRARTSARSEPAPAARREPRPPALGRRARRGGGDRGRGGAPARRRGPTRRRSRSSSRDPARRGPLLASVLESYGVPAALEAEIPVATTAVGGSLIALLEAVLGTGQGGRPAALPARPLRGLAGTGRLVRAQAPPQHGSRPPPRRCELWEERYGGAARTTSPGSARRRDAPARTLGDAEVGGAGRRRWAPAPGSELELRAAGAIATALAERAELDGLAPLPRLDRRALAAICGPGLERAGRGPGAGSPTPTGVRAARFDNVFVASLQDGEFPRGAGGGDPFLSERQRESLGLQPRRDTEAEERYLFHACLALPRTAALPLLPRQRRERRRRGALALPRRRPARCSTASRPEPTVERVAAAASPRSSTGSATRPRRPSWRGRSPPRGPGADPDGAARGRRRRGRDRRADRRRAWPRRARRRGGDPGAGAALQPGRDRARSARSRAYGGTTLEGFDVCSYRWFVSHELSPQPLDPLPDPLVQGGIDARRPRAPSTGSGPAATRSRGPASLAAWIARGRELVAEIAAERGLGEHPAERAMLAPRRGPARPLPRRGGAARDRRLRALAAGGGVLASPRRPSEPALEIDGWRLHGAIDRVDRAPDGRALVLDYKLSSKVTPRRKARGGGEAAAAALPDRGRRALGRGGRSAASTTRCAATSRAAAARARARGRGGRPRRATGSRAPTCVDREEFEELLADARRRAGEIVARMRAGRHRPRPGPAPGPARPRHLPALLRLRADLPPRPGAGRADDDDDEEERAVSERRAAPRSSGGDRGAAARRGAGRGRRRHRQDRGDGRPLLPAGLRAGRLARRDPRLHLHRQGRRRAAPADPGRDRAPGRGRARSAPASCCRASAAPG